MKHYLFSILLGVFALPLIGKADAPFFTQPGKYTLSPAIALTVSLDEEKEPKVMLRFSEGGGIGHNAHTAHPGDPFLIYWDDAKEILWYGTAQEILYLDVHKHHSTRSCTYRRSVPIKEPKDSPPVPIVFSTELDRTIPAQP